MMNKVKNILAFGMMACACFHAAGETVTAEQARKAAATWAARNADLSTAVLGTAQSAQTQTAEDGTLFHVVPFSKGGAVVLSGDTGDEPVVAVTPDTQFLEDAENPLLKLLAEDARVRASARAAKSGTSAAKSGTSAAKLMMTTAAQVSSVDDVAVRNAAKWRELLSDLPQTQSASSVADVRVTPMLQSLWGQETTDNNVNCYNYYTPNNLPCGCTATATAQILKYFGWQSQAVPTWTNGYCTVANIWTQLTVEGGWYDFAAMPLDPESGITDTGRKAIGRLMSDIGVIMGADYDYNSSGQTATSPYMPYWVFKQFGYSNATILYDTVCTTNDAARTLMHESVRQATIPNLEAGLPVFFGLAGDSGAHAAVADGYGYSDETLYYHMNMGWKGAADVWYAPPDLTALGLTFNTIYTVIYNIYTNQPSTASICSGRVTDTSGVPIPGATVTAKDANGTAIATRVTNVQGSYALTLEPGTYTFEVTKSGAQPTSSNVTMSSCVSLRLWDVDSGYYRYYNNKPTPVVNNILDQDFVLKGIETVKTPVLSREAGKFLDDFTLTITCATADATIRYTIDGSTPDETSTLYTSDGILISDSVTVKVRAFKDGMNPSAIAVATYESGKVKHDLFSDALKLTGTNLTSYIDNTGASKESSDEPTHSTKYVGGGYSVWWKWTAPGSGVLRLRANGYTYVGSDNYYHAMWPFLAMYTGTAVDDLTRVPFTNKDANGTETDAVWCYVSGEVYGQAYISERIYNVTKGTTYYIAVDNGTAQASITDEMFGPVRLVLNATLDNPETLTSPVAVPYAWLESYGFSESANYENVALLTGANGCRVWESYLAGLDPTDADSVLRATIRFENGTPVVEWNVTNNAAGSFGYEYRVYGKAELEDGWVTPYDSNSRFFQVRLEEK